MASVNIGGADNKITFEKVDKELSVVGLNNTVSYKGPITAKATKVSTPGNKNTVTRQK